MSSPPAGALPVGFRFRPTDEELVRHYLKAKIAGRAHPDLLLIPDVDLSACEPWELPAKALIKSDDPEWFFFAPLDRKYPGGRRSNRSTAAGYWKATGKDRLIRARPAGTLIGVKKTLVFHRGRAPRGHRTAWIMHEYRTAEPQLQQKASFVLYRLFNKHEEEAEDAADAPSTSSPASADQAHTAPVVKAQNLTQPASTKLPHLLTTVSNNEPAPPQQEDDPLLDVLAQLPDLQPEQTHDGFPIITSPMRPYTDHPFVGDVGGQDLSAYIDSIIAHQDLEDLLLSPVLAETGNADPNTTAPLMPTNGSNDKRLPENGWAKTDSDGVLLVQGADGTAAAHCSCATNILQMDTGDANNYHTGAQTNLAYSASAQVSHLYNQYQLQAAFSPEMEPTNSVALCSAGSLTPYPQHLLNNMVEPAMSDMANSDFMDPQQGTAARRIRLVHSIQRPSVTEPALTSHLENEDEAGPCYSTDGSSTNNNKDYANVISQNMAGGAMHIQDGGVIPTQVVSSMEVTGTLQDFTFDEGISPHGEVPHGGNLKQRLKQECTRTSRKVPCHSDSVPGEPSLRRRQQAAPIGSVVRLLCLALAVILVFVGLWKSILYKSLY